nr:hypothetical protein Iba_chr15aCG10970 [Ipomoea batatas]
MIAGWSHGIVETPREFEVRSGRDASDCEVQRATIANVEFQCATNANVEVVQGAFVITIDVEVQVHEAAMAAAVGIAAIVQEIGAPLLPFSRLSHASTWLPGSSEKLSFRFTPPPNKLSATP